MNANRRKIRIRNTVINPAKKEMLWVETPREVKRKVGTCDRIELDVSGSRHLSPVGWPKSYGRPSPKTGACWKTKGMGEARRFSAEFVRPTGCENQVTVPAKKLAPPSKNYSELWNIVAGCFFTTLRFFFPQLLCICTYKNSNINWALFSKAAMIFRLKLVLILWKIRFSLKPISL
jgi:hypothetical protein